MQINLVRNPLNILVLAHRLPFPANKGEKIRTFNQIKGLIEQGHQVHVLSPQESSLDIHANEHFEEQFQGLQSELFPSGLKIKRLLAGLLGGESLSVANFYNKSMQKAFDQLLLESSVDAVVCTSSAMVKYISKSNTLPQITTKRPKLLMDFMDLDSDKWRQYAEKSHFPFSWLYKREQKLIEAAEAESQSLFDACYLIAKAETAMFKQVHGNLERVAVLGNGMNMKEFYPSPTGKQFNIDAPVFIFTGVMDYKPNIDAVLWFIEHCWAEVRAKYHNAKFIVAGMNPVKELVELNDTDGIAVTGFVEEILPYYHQADYFVAPFRLARGVQNKVLQAFACGLPVITTPMGAEGIPCVDDKDVLLANTPEEFIAQIDKLQGDRNIAESLSDNALTLIQEQFSWDGMLRPLYDEITKRDI